MLLKIYGRCSITVRESLFSYKRELFVTLTPRIVTEGEDWANYLLN